MDTKDVGNKGGNNMLRPVGKNILVKLKPLEKKSGLILPDSKDKPFEVIVVGKGDKVELEIEVGQTLLVAPYGGSRIDLNDSEEYYLATERDVIGIIKE